MKKRITVIITVLTLAAAVFCGLWIQEKNDRSELVRLCQSCAVQSLQDFREYRGTGSEAHYWQGVSNFKAFMNAYLAVNEQSTPEYVWCNSVYGSMVISPAKAQSNVNELIAALEIIGADYTDPNGYIKMAELNNLLKHG